MAFSFSVLVCFCAILLTCNLFSFMLMSTGCLAPPAPMVTPGSQYSNSIFNIFFVICHMKKARVQIKIVSCCCHRRELQCIKI